MGNVGIGELALLVLLVLLVFGPNKLPEIMRNLGKAYRVFQHETQKAATVLRESIEPPATQTPPGPGIVDTPDGVAPVLPVSPHAGPAAEPVAGDEAEPRARTLEDT
jgi:sec-independent protein translocase protein TatA